VWKRSEFVHQELEIFCNNYSDSFLESLTVTRVESFCLQRDSSRVTIFFNVTRVESPKIVTQALVIDSSHALTDFTFIWMMWDTETTSYFRSQQEYCNHYIQYLFCPDSCFLNQPLRWWYIPTLEVERYAGGAEWRRRPLVRGHHHAGCRSGLRKESTIFAEAGAGPGVGFLNENRIRSWSRSENFSFCRSRIIYFVKYNFLWTANC